MFKLKLKMYRCCTFYNNGSPGWLSKKPGLRIFQNWVVLKKLLGLKKEKIKVGHSKVSNKELCNVYSLPHIILVTNQGRCAGWGVWYTRDRKIHKCCQWGNLKESDHLEDLGTDGKMVVQ
jgi:hypothetical protein